MGTTEPRVAVYGRDKDGHRVNLGDVPVSTYRRDSRVLLGLAPKEKPKVVKEDKPKKSILGTKSKSKGKSKKR